MVGFRRAVGFVRLNRHIFPLPVDYVPSGAVEETHLRKGADYALIGERIDDRGGSYLCVIDDWRHCWIPKTAVTFFEK